MSSAKTQNFSWIVLSLLLLATALPVPQVQAQQPGDFIDIFVDVPGGGLVDPRGLGFGPDGHLYVSSHITDEVLRYDGTTGLAIDAFVTEGSGGLSQPDGLVFGPDGHLYVSSFATDEVLRYDGTSGAVIDAFVTSESGGLSFPRGLVFGPDDNLYVSSARNEVLRYDGATGAFIDAFVTSGSGGLTQPYGLVFGPDGHLYVSSISISPDSGDRVYRYDGTTGAFIDEFVPVRSGGLVSPDGLVFGPDGHLYVSSIGTDEVLRYDGATGAFIDAFVTAGSGGLMSPDGLVFGPDGHLYVSSGFPSRVLRYDGATGAFLEDFTGKGLDGPRGLLFGPDGDLYVNSVNTDEVQRYDGITGAFLDAFVTAQSGGLDGPSGLVFGPDGNLYVCNFLNNEVLRYNGATGAFIDAFIPAGSGGLDQLQALVFGSDGHLYVSSGGSDEVLRYDGATGAFIDAFVTAGSGGLDGPSGLVFGPDGTLYVASFFTHEVQRYDGATGAFIDVFVAAGRGGLNAPYGMVFGSNGHLYVSSIGSDEVLRYNGTSGAFIDAFVAARSSDLFQPRGLVFGPDGNLYVSSGNTNQVLRYEGPGPDSPGPEGPTTMYSGNTTDAPTFDRPDCDEAIPPAACMASGRSTRFEKALIIITETADYTITSSQDYDGLLILYTAEGGFDPDFPLDDVLAFNDDDADDRTSKIEANLATSSGNHATPYPLVTTGYSDSDVGAYTNTVTSSAPGVFLASDGTDLWSAPTANTADLGLEWNRPDCPDAEGDPLLTTSCTTKQESFQFFVHEFISFCPANGPHFFLTDQDFDGVVLLYEGSFDLTNPLENLIAYNDDWPGTPDGERNSAFLAPLLHDRGYFLVTTSASAGDTGDFAHFIFGPEGCSLETLATAVEDTDEAPQRYDLSPVYPNPFNPQAQFTLSVGQAQRVAIDVFDVLGRQVGTLHDGVLAPGTQHQFTFDAANLPSGLYMIRAQGDTFSDTRRAFLVK